ncbi:MAG: hypothetical protein ACRKGH_02325 [Dehalogenimonas sp.]
MASKTVSLEVEGQTVELASFVQSYFEHVLSAILATLDTDRQDSLVIIDVNDEHINITVNNKTVELNPFVALITLNTTTGMVKSLRGIDTADNFTIELSKG